LYLSGRFLHEAEVEANQKQDEMDEATNPQKSGDIVVNPKKEKGKGTAI
jgi:hypothetical protein